VEAAYCHEVKRSLLRWVALLELDPLALDSIVDTVAAAAVAVDTPVVE